MQGTSRTSFGADVSEIKPDLKPVQNAAGVTWQYVILSIATTGFNIDEDEICQIALCYKGAQRCFKCCEHVLPDKEFHEDATISNGF